MGMLPWAPGPWERDGGGLRFYSDSSNLSYGDSYLWANWRSASNTLLLWVTHRGRASVPRIILEARYLPTDGDPMALLDMLAEVAYKATEDERRMEAYAALKVHRDSTPRRFRPPAWLAENPRADFGLDLLLSATARYFLVESVRPATMVDRASGAWLEWTEPEWAVCFAGPGGYKVFRLPLGPVLGVPGLPSTMRSGSVLWASAWWVWGVTSLARCNKLFWSVGTAPRLERGEEGWRVLGSPVGAASVDGGATDCPWTALARACRAMGWTWAGPESGEALKALGDVDAKVS